MSAAKTIRDYIDIVESRGIDLAKRAQIEKWTRQTLNDAGVVADVSSGVVYVRNETDKVRAAEAIAANEALMTTQLPVRVAPASMRL